MKKIIHYCTVLALLLAPSIVGSAIQAHQPLYIITGRVLDENGNPLEKAKVYAIPCCIPINGRIIYYDTDSEGRFAIKLYYAGDYDVHAFKKDAGYPDTWAVPLKRKRYKPNPDAIKRVAMSGDVKSVEVELRLGPKLKRK